MQPKDGDVVVHCGHIDAGLKHLYELTPPRPFTRPDHTKGLAKFLITCDACLATASQNPLRVLIRGDATWDGDAPLWEDPTVH